jgi:hypothetical protein
MNTQRTVTLPANGNYVEGVGKARYFSCISASAPFQVRFGNGHAKPASTGVNIAASAEIGTLTLLNNAAVAVEVTFEYGDEAIATLPNVLGSFILFADAQTQLNMPNGSRFTYTGLRFGRQRKYLAIHNGTNSGDVDIEDSAGNRLFRVSQNSSERLDVSDDLAVHNISGAAARISVYEVF